MKRIYRKAAILKCDFNKVAQQLYWNHTLALVSPVNLFHIFKIPFLTNTSGRLLLHSTDTLRIKHSKEKTNKKWSWNPPKLFLCKISLLNLVSFPHTISTMNSDSFLYKCQGSYLSTIASVYENQTPLQLT